MRFFISLCCFLGLLFTSFSVLADEFTDRRILHMIQIKLDRNFKNTDVDIDVYVRDAVVNFSGEVDTGAQRHVLLNIGKNTTDVKKVISKVRIRGVREKTDYTWDDWMKGKK
jgi:osmotically-inducible protein OsmY